MCTCLHVGVHVLVLCSCCLALRCASLRCDVLCCAELSRAVLSCIVLCRVVTRLALRSWAYAAAVAAAPPWVQLRLVSCRVPRQHAQGILPPAPEPMRPPISRLRSTLGGGSPYRCWRSACMGAAAPRLAALLKRWRGVHELSTGGGLDWACPSLGAGTIREQTREHDALPGESHELQRGGEAEALRYQTSDPGPDGAQGSKIPASPVPWESLVRKHIPEGGLAQRQVSAMMPLGTGIW